MAAQSNELEMVYVVDGDRAPRSRWVAPDQAVAEVIKAVGRELQREDLEAMYREDEDKALAPKTQMQAVLAGDFQVLHLGGHGKDRVEVSYNGRTVQETVSPATTLRSVLAWAISPKALGLQGDLSDFQLKLGGELLPLELHIGQLAQGHEPVRLTLVFKVKPQG